MLRPALIGGILLGILSSLPIISAFNCVCCAWIIGGGMLAAYLYVKDSVVPVTLGHGVVLGLFTGLIGAAVNTLFMIPVYFLINQAGAGFMEALREALERVPNLPPEVEVGLRDLWSKTGIGMFFLIMSLIFMFLLFCLAAMLGGALGVALFEKRKIGAPPHGTAPPQTPLNLPPSADS